MLDAGAGLYGQLAVVSAVEQVRGDTSRPVAGDFRLRAVGIDQADAHVGFRGRKEPLHAVCANAVVAVADFFSVLEHVWPGLSPPNYQEMLVPSRRLCGWGHPLITRP